jgi:hypothetical protein
MEFYSAIKNNENMSFSGKWMEPKDFMLTQVKHQKITGHMFFLRCTN